MSPPDSNATAHLPPPYGLIARRFKAGQVVPFLGAGASLVGRPTGSSWNINDEPVFLPNGRELARCLAEQLSLPTQEEDLAKISALFVDLGGREVLRELLRVVFTSRLQPGPLHELLAEVPSPITIVATNYDTLIEQAFAARGRAYDLLVYPADNPAHAAAVLHQPHGAPEPAPVDPAKLDIDLTKTNVIFKMHGSVIAAQPSLDSYVISEDDYAAFLSRMAANTAIPNILVNHFSTRAFLFLGYGLADWNMRVLLRKCFEKRDPSSSPSWAVQRSPSAIERELWSSPSRRVKIFDADLSEFAQRLRAELGV